MKHEFCVTQLLAAFQRLLVGGSLGSLLLFESHVASLAGILVAVIGPTASICPTGPGGNFFPSFAGSQSLLGVCSPENGGN